MRDVVDSPPRGRRSAGMGTVCTPGAEPRAAAAGRKWVRAQEPQTRCSYWDIVGFHDSTDGMSSICCVPLGQFPKAQMTVQFLQLQCLYARGESTVPSLLLQKLVLIWLYNSHSCQTKTLCTASMFPALQPLFVSYESIWKLSEFADLSMTCSFFLKRHLNLREHKKWAKYKITGSDTGVLDAKRPQGP